MTEGNAQNSNPDHRVPASNQSWRSPGIGRAFGGRRPRGTAKPKNFTRTMRRLWQYLRQERRMLIVIFFLILADSVLALIGPYIIGVTIDSMTAPAPQVTLEVLLLILAVTYLADWLLGWGQGWLMAGISQQVVRQLRATLFAKLQKLPLAYFDVHPHGELMSRLANDTDNVSNTISQSISHLMSASIAITGSFVMMLVLSPVLTLAALITLPLVIILTRVISQKTNVLFKKTQVELGHLNAHVEETVAGIQVIKAFNHEHKAIADFKTINHRLCEVGSIAQIWSALLMPIMNVITNIGFGAIAIVGGVLAVHDVISVGTIASFISYSRQFVRPVNELANIFNTLQSGVAGAERVFEVLDQAEEPADLPEAVELADPKGEVVFDHVSFGYRPDMPVLKEVNFVAAAGTSTALVGSTGAGKTTIVNLLTRFYDVTGGRILLDGRDIRQYTRDSLRTCFGIVLQDTYLFSGTIKDNIRYGRPAATDDEMEQAALLANAAAFIKRLPYQYDTWLSENGGNLSQGQRQLIAIARAILADPAILILDEATSSIDTRTEYFIQDALRNIMKGRTTFIIAHRLNTIQEADQILVLKNGQIVEQGNHSDLLNAKGLYAAVFSNQLESKEDFDVLKE
ncbi:ABC transporter ATP-binding protein [Sporomusa acidovorans]|uniref:ABC transporter ATP-binding protein n=1 Tax=Sporomusa acidovorans (strain ATCC 49682 / DSM 3132 / Mol) TaxID=1123286 RepID=A0ABZ3IZ29_SPOA4|nr:ABC transporter ATP-binding protein [Sporomusa acidovorans]OZC18316.1 putative ABC transporter ATP-binding protein [Sporomusa acidovorans DSM 3132]SDF20230.1 ATP-binding cassette, subfamily B [Sporomusa acidovorans]